MLSGRRASFPARAVPARSIPARFRGPGGSIRNAEREKGAFALAGEFIRFPPARGSTRRVRLRVGGADSRQLHPQRPMPIARISRLMQGALCFEGAQAARILHSPSSRVAAGRRVRGATRTVRLGPKGRVSGSPNRRPAPTGKTSWAQQTEREPVRRVRGPTPRVRRPERPINGQHRRPVSTRSRGGAQAPPRIDLPPGFGIRPAGLPNGAFGGGRPRTVSKTVHQPAAPPGSAGFFHLSRSRAAREHFGLVKGCNGRTQAGA